ncbi:SIR2 family NAD-dependent protein deacylase [Burkholderia multivorans]|uniref:SIR2 family NAD-dependent protein deacylase n=1 Tax=Burkholderia multivorans TaxID=87883 RepID=UPI0021BF91FF|nr:Sir2 family NAD-dependent protein deacetylase [Burkholderia multivorans]
MSRTQPFPGPRLYVFSGAGLSAESGIPTFRTGGGIWSQESIDEVCNFLTWRRNREAVFRFYNERIAEKRDARPNDAHRILASWQAMWGPGRVRLITQNIDDLLEQAGALHVTHLHGDMHSMLCTACDLRFPKSGENYRLDTVCPRCGTAETVKPGVVFFQEAAPEYVKLHRMQHDMTDEDVFIAIGTAFEVISPEAMLPRAMVPARTKFFGRPGAASNGVFWTCGIGTCNCRPAQPRKPNSCVDDCVMIRIAFIRH